MQSNGKQKRYVLAFDTANERISVGLASSEIINAKKHPSSFLEDGILFEGSYIQEHVVAHKEVQAHRQSNALLLDVVQELCTSAGATMDDIAGIIAGRGPGSFTGVRICLATAKGIALSAGIPLYGISTLDAVAWNAWQYGARGVVCVVADAMRKEVYPSLYIADDIGVVRLTKDTVVKAIEAHVWLKEALERQEIATALDACGKSITYVGDALAKYPDLPHNTQLLFDGISFKTAPEQSWHPSAFGLFASVRAGGDASMVLPVYTRLSDAEENERSRSSAKDPKNLMSGVQSLHVTLEGGDVTFVSMHGDHLDEVAALELACMKSDAWSKAQFAEELSASHRSWWVALFEDNVVGYAGMLLAGDIAELLKVAVAPSVRQRNIATQLLHYVASDMRDLGATSISLEVREKNLVAQALYNSLDLRHVGTRKTYYSDGEDACVYAGNLPINLGDVAGMRMQVNEAVASAAQGGAHRFKNKDLPSLPHPVILAFESSCDETAAAIIDGNGQVVSDVVASQVDFHARFGGVVPEIASRKHIEAIYAIARVAIERAFSGATADDAGELSHQDIHEIIDAHIDAIAVTTEPGLVGALVVGTAFAKGLSWAAHKPLISINHLEGHIYANKLAYPDIQPPFVASVVSGGHTLLIHVKEWGDYETLGSTIDDAVGEAFDKVAKALGLGYPGGPKISEQAKQGNPSAIDFPRALMHSKDFRFSLSGLKTAVINYIHKQKQSGEDISIPDVAASFQQAVIDVQVAKAKEAIRQTNVAIFCLGGGVAANPELRGAYEKMGEKLNVRIVLPPLSVCGDNAAMIAAVALDKYAKKQFAAFDLDVAAHAPLDDIE